jgi:hypothetical protein
VRHFVGTQRHRPNTVENHSEIATQDCAEQCPHIESGKSLTEITPTLRIEGSTPYLLHRHWDADVRERELKLLVGDVEGVEDLALAIDNELVANSWPIAGGDCVVDALEVVDSRSRSGHLRSKRCTGGSARGRRYLTIETRREPRLSRWHRTLGTLRVERYPDWSAEIEKA